MNPLEYLFRIKTDGRQAEAEVNRVKGSLGRLEVAAAAAGTKISGVMASMARFGPMIGIAAGALAKSSLDRAGQVSDLAKRSGVSTESVQRWWYAADQGGASIGDVMTSFKFLQRSMVDAVDNPKSDQAAAFERLGITKEMLQTQNPETIFNAVSAAMASAPEGARTTKTALDLFGRSGDVMLGLARDGFAGAASQAPVLADDKVQSLDATGDRVTELWDRMRTGMMEVLSVLTMNVDDIKSDWDKRQAGGGTQTPQMTADHLEKIRQEQAETNRILRESL